MEIKKKKRIAIISIIIAVIMIIIASIFIIFFRNDVKQTSNQSIEEIRNVPDVSLENTIFEMSETELTNEKIKITISSQLENYNLYYCINPMEEQDSEIEENYIQYEDGIELEQNANLYFKYELDGKYSENPYILEINNINEEIIEEPLENEGATEEQLQKEKVTKISNTAPYYIVVNYVANVVTIYGKDENNEYTRPVKAMVCSTGVATPRSGVYKLGARSKWRALFGNVYGQYAVNIVGNILFHSVPYLNTDNGTLEYWEYDKLGTSASAGCIRLTVADALWIYNNCGSGTQVEFSSNAPTPLGKPGAKKISGYPDLRGFDPTDPASNNPWKNANISQNNNNNNSNNNGSQGQKPEPPKEEEPEEPKKPETEEKPSTPDKTEEPDKEDDKTPPTTDEEKKDLPTDSTDN